MKEREREGAVRISYRLQKPSNWAVQLLTFSLFRFVRPETRAGRLGKERLIETRVSNRMTTV
jgi:hypothetical protein